MTEGDIDEEQLQAEIGTFIMAGYETTAHTLSFTIHSIARNRKIQQNIVSELQRTGLLDESGTALRDIVYTDLPALPYLGGVLKESMRKFPVVAAFPRLVSKILSMSYSMRSLRRLSLSVWLKYWLNKVDDV